MIQITNLPRQVVGEISSFYNSNGVEAGSGALALYFQRSYAGSQQQAGRFFRTISRRRARSSPAPARALFWRTRTVSCPSWIRPCQPTKASAPTRPRRRCSVPNVRSALFQTCDQRLRQRNKHPGLVVALELGPGFLERHLWVPGDVDWQVVLVRHAVLAGHHVLLLDVVEHRFESFEGNADGDDHRA
jgi:hypothetical protein